ncbi:MAG TPA: VOC family protein [Alphaproteobacteria bacterium]|nr:VOC family protein [Alphaproteobacteria bacterium]
MTLQPYLFFEGSCEEALAFYRAALGAELDMLMRFKDAPDPAARAAGNPEKVMHAQFRVGDTVIMASDGRASGAPSFQGFALALSVADEAEATRLFNALAEGGQVRMPLAKTFFAKIFGMVADRFGIVWMVLAPARAPGG